MEQQKFTERSIKCKEADHKDEEVTSVCLKSQCPHGNLLNCTICAIDIKVEYAQYHVPIRKIEQAKDSTNIPNWPNKDHNVKDIAEYVKENPDVDKILEDTKEKLIKLRKTFITIFDQAIRLVEDTITEKVKNSQLFVNNVKQKFEEAFSLKKLQQILMDYEIKDSHEDSIKKIKTFADDKEREQNI